MEKFYKVIEGSDYNGNTGRFFEEVEKHLNAGWTLVGGVSVAVVRSEYGPDSYYAQAMTMEVAPAKCHCTTRCMAPVVMGTQAPCLEPGKFLSEKVCRSCGGSPGNHADDSCINICGQFGYTELPPNRGTAG